MLQQTRSTTAGSSRPRAAERSAYSVEQTTTMRRTVGSMRPMPCLRHENPLLVGSSVADGTTAADRRAPSKARLAIDGSRKA